MRCELDGRGAERPALARLMLGWAVAPWPDATRWGYNLGYESTGSVEWA